MVTNRAGRNEEVATLFELRRDGFSRRLSPRDDVHDELLNKFGLHLGGDAVVFLVACSLV
jgi:hypothetical protein